MTARRLLLLLILFLAPGVNSSATDLIIRTERGADIHSIVASIRGRLVDTLQDASNPQGGIYLVFAPATPSELLPGVTWIEQNTPVDLSQFRVSILSKNEPQGNNNNADNGNADNGDANNGDHNDSLPRLWYRDQPAMKLIGLNDALHRATGGGIVVADINSAVDYGHPALKGHLTGGYDFVGGSPSGAIQNQSSAGFLDQSTAAFLDQSTAAFLDQSTAGFLDQSTAGFLDTTNAAHGHGTLVAGIILAVAPDSMIMPLRVFDDYGQADIFNIAKAIRYAVQSGAHVINLSFGILEPSETVKDVIDFAISSNVVVVASAGNENTEMRQYPAAFTGVIGVAATDLSDKKALFSNFGTAIFVAAPGVNIISSYPGAGGLYYGVVSGTSFSAATVAGLSALVRSSNPSESMETIAETAVKIDLLNPNYAGRLGYGRVSATRAVH